VAAVPTKQLVRQLLDELPDDCTIEDVQYRLHVLDAVARGRAELAAGRMHRHEDVVADLGRRWGKNRDR
jgi:predicted transcriptional regulator